MEPKDLVDSWWKASEEINGFWQLLLVLHSGGLGWFADHLRGSKNKDFYRAFAALSFGVHLAIGGALAALYRLQNNTHGLLERAEYAGRATAHPPCPAGPCHPVADALGTAVASGGALFGFLFGSWAFGVFLAYVAVMRLPPKTP